MIKMKKIYFIAIVLMSFVMTSCLEKGEVSQSVFGQEENLPAELKGLKIYRVGTGFGNEIKIAVLNGQAIATNYKEGKYEKYVAIINDEASQIHREIYAKGVISENDSIIVLRK